MSEPEPYVQKNPGDLIQSEDWNNLQVRAREEIRIHRHTGEADGAKIPRAAIEDRAIDGSKIDPEARVVLKKLRVTGDLYTREGLRAVPGVDLSLRTDGGALTIARDGKVGVGVPAPKVKLHIDGAIRGPDPSGMLKIATESGALELGAGSEHYAQYITDRPRHYFNRELVVDGGRVSAFGGDIHLCVGGEPRLTVKSEGADLSSQAGGALTIRPQAPEGECRVETSCDHLAIGAAGNTLSLRTGGTPKLTIHGESGGIRGNGPGGQLEIATGHGILWIGPRHDGLSHFETDRPEFYFNKSIRVDTGRIGSHKQNLFLCVQGKMKITVDKDGSIRGSAKDGSLQIKTGHGDLWLGPQSTGHCHLRTNMGAFYFDKPVQVDTGKIGSYDENLYLCVKNEKKVTVTTSGHIYYRSLARVEKGLTPEGADIPYILARKYIEALRPIRYKLGGTTYYGFRREEKGFPKEFALGDNGISYEAILAFVVGIIQMTAPSYGSDPHKMARTVVHGK